MAAMFIESPFCLTADKACGGGDKREPFSPPPPPADDPEGWPLAQQIMKDLAVAEGRRESSGVIGAVEAASKVRDVAPPPPPVVILGRRLKPRARQSSLRNV